MVSVLQNVTFFDFRVDFPGTTFVGSSRSAIILPSGLAEFKQRGWRLPGKGLPKGPFSLENYLCQNEQKATRPSTLCSGAPGSK